MAKQSAGILAFRKGGEGLEVFLVHPGGPLWKNRDLGAWSIPKGEFLDEDSLAAAKREFREETGLHIAGEFVQLNLVKQKSGKVIHAWAVEADFTTLGMKSNSFEMTWPPRSGKIASFPEVDGYEWFTVEMARARIIEGQIGLLDQLECLMPGYR